MVLLYLPAEWGLSSFKFASEIYRLAAIEPEMAMHGV
jgi:hypothetical protein